VGSPFPDGDCDILEHPVVLGLARRLNDWGDVHFEKPEIPEPVLLDRVALPETRTPRRCAAGER
jgi:hypothetical protein